MSWSPKKKTSNKEFGEYLPDDEAQLNEGSEPIYTRNDKQAQEKYQEVAAEYGGVEAKVEPTDRKNEYDCQFKFWG